MTDYKYDKVTSVRVGRTAIDCQTITNVLYWSTKVVAVEGDMVLPLTVINDYNPSGVHQSHKYLEMEMALDTDWLTETTGASSSTNRWAYTQHVDLADSKPAIDEDGANTSIEFLEVDIREHDGTAAILQYTLGGVRANVVWCTGEKTTISNEDNTMHQTVVFRFISLVDEVRA